MAYTVPAVVLNLVLIFGGAWLAIGPMLGYGPRHFVWKLAIQVAAPWFAVLMAWCFPGRYSVFHGLGGRGGASELLYRLGERRIHLFGIWFPTFYALSL